MDLVEQRLSTPPRPELSLLGLGPEVTSLRGAASCMSTFVIDVFARLHRRLASDDIVDCRHRLSMRWSRRYTSARTRPRRSIEVHHSDRETCSTSRSVIHRAARRGGYSSRPSAADGDSYDNVFG